MAYPRYDRIDDTTDIEQPESGRVEKSYQVDAKVTFIHEAKYYKALSLLPAVGSAKSEAGVSGIVTAASLEPIKGGRMARAIYTIEARNANAIIEINWQQIQRPLLLHPRYRVGAGGAKVLTKEDLADIESWKGMTQRPANYGTFQLPATGATGYKYLQANAQDYAAKFLQGEDNFLEFVPVAKITIIDYLVVTAAKCGVYSASAPVTGCPSGYVWLKTGDTLHYDAGYWTRSIEWTGAFSWDTDIYEAATNPPYF